MILQIFTLPFIVTLQVTQHSLDLLTLEHEPQVLVVREVPVELEFACASRSFVLWLDSGGYFVLFVLDLQLVDGVEQLGQVEVGLQFREILHNEVHFLMIMMRLQFLPGELLVAVPLGEVLCLVVRDGSLLAHCFLDEFEELLVGHHYSLFYWKNRRKSKQMYRK